MPSRPPARALAIRPVRPADAARIATRVTRERAHGFYRGAGYELLKTSHIFEKGLG